jgi:hypothetical protein
MVIKFSLPRTGDAAPGTTGGRASPLLAYPNFGHTSPWWEEETTRFQIERYGVRQRLTLHLGKAGITGASQTIPLFQSSEGAFHNESFPADQPVTDFSQVYPAWETAC